MKQFSQQLHKKAKTSVKLQVAEKADLKDRLVAYMEYHPLPAEMKQNKSAQTKTTIAAEPFTMVKVPFAAIFKYSSAFAVLLLLVVPFAAERSVPGDTLYAVKVKVNEEIRGTLTFGSYQKVEWETERLNRRIAEARLLASEGRLTEEVEAEVALAVRTHTENAKREIEVLRAEDADEATIASIALDTTLEVQSASLKGEEEAGEAANEADSQVDMIVSAIDESRDPAVEETSEPALPAYNKLMARAEQNTTRIYELRTMLTEVVSEEELAEVTRRVEDIERSMQEAIEVVESDDKLAREILIDVIQRSQRLIVFMTELEVTNTVDIEEIVPVVLTDDEKQAEHDRLAAELDALTVKIPALVEQIEEESVLEKVEVASVSIEELKAKMASSSEDFEAYEAAAAEAIALATDTVSILEQIVNPIEEEVIEPEEETSTSTEEVIEPEEETSTSTEEVAEEPVEDESPVEVEEESAEETVEPEPVETDQVEGV
jgi:hypothetical protein